MEFNPRKYFAAHTDLFQKIDVSAIERAIELVETKFEAGKKIITCGNGGSATTSSHMITDWTKMVTLATGKKFYGYSLVDNVGLITAYANDINYSKVFSGQLKSILDKEDLLIVLSGSGNSGNIIEALHFANDLRADTLAIVGFDGGEARKLAKYCIHIPSFDMQLCEDIHLMINHMVMKKLCGLDIKN